MAGQKRKGKGSGTYMYSIEDNFCFLCGGGGGGGVGRHVLLKTYSKPKYQLPIATGIATTSS